LTLLEVFILGHFDPPSTGRIQQLAYNTNHKQAATKQTKLLHKYLIMVNFMNSENCAVQFKRKKNTIPTALFVGLYVR